ncbi:MAG TPA: hypothetical protein VL738_35050 [Dactylosporangium sp.]|jgi:hypothetical protein|nr:hypothetical protein [Dactylosporangium sp.]
MARSVPSAGGEDLVVAVIDERQCSLAAVRHAAQHSGRLVVLARPRQLLSEPVLTAHGLTFQPDDRLAAELFAEAAVLLAACDRRWHFGLLPPGRTLHQAVAAAAPSGGTALVVVARHRHGAGRVPWLGDPPLPRLGRAAWVPCDL